MLGLEDRVFRFSWWPIFSCDFGIWMIFSWKFRYYFYWQTKTFHQYWSILWPKFWFLRNSDPNKAHSFVFIIKVQNQNINFWMKLLFLNKYPFCNEKFNLWASFIFWQKFYNQNLYFPLWSKIIIIFISLTKIWNFDQKLYFNYYFWRKGEI